MVAGSNLFYLFLSWVNFCMIFWVSGVGRFVCFVLLLLLLFCCCFFVLFFGGGGGGGVLGYAGVDSTSVRVGFFPR